MVTALYDCRSKQEYIYRTNKIREISGASTILTKIYDWMIDEAEKHGIQIDRTWKDREKPFDMEAFAASGDDGIVIYEGGGNLFVLYKNRETYVKVNRIFTRMLLERTYSVSIITACVETTDNFAEDRKKLYRQKALTKNTGTYSSVCNVLPFTQLDRMTMMPIVSKAGGKQRTQEILHKRDAFRELCVDTEQKELLDDLTDVDDSLLAVIYIDGNDMGNKIKACTEGKEQYPDCVEALRSFSLRTDEIFVKKPLEAIERCLRQKNENESDLIKAGNRKEHKYRKIIGGGDEITIICRAEDAADIVHAYFEELAKMQELAPGKPNASCAGIAIFHSHAPFADVYEIAEACCESGKKRTRESGSTVSYIDFHYCHSGITNGLDVLRETQEKDLTARPYSVEKFAEFRKLIRILSHPCIGRSNVKSLGEAIIQGEAAYLLELERLRARDTEGDFTRLIDSTASDEEKKDLKQQIYDASVIFDLWKEDE
ncbi:MAG: hypothetical protein IJ825_09335 [Oscillospiraceae bacterium]|nr:hypothetical protein [Oscillospiraceae bacterium]